MSCTFNHKLNKSGFDAIVLNEALKQTGKDCSLKDGSAHSSPPHAIEINLSILFHLFPDKDGSLDGFVGD